MRTGLIFYAGIFLLLQGSCHPSAQPENKNAAPLRDFTFMLGSWEMQDGNTVITEEWKQENDSTFSGSSWMYPKDSAAAKILLEEVRLVSRMGKVQYIPTVKDQNNGEAVAFTFTGKKGNDFVFENPAHDFPQRIIYSPGENKLDARIEGKKNGMLQTEQFPYMRNVQ